MDTCVPSEAAEWKEGEMFKVMTFNANYFNEKHGSWKKRKEVIAQLICEKMPDVVALQAVAHHLEKFDGVDQASQIAQLAGYRHCHFVVAEEADGIRKGQAFISRYQPKALQIKRLSMGPEPEDPFRRLILMNEYQTTSGILRIFNVHFSWVDAQAKDNVMEVAEFLKSFKGMGLLVGDLNMPPHSALLRTLRTEGWEDIWTVLDKGEPGYTFESHAPSMRIDYVLTNPALKEYVHRIEVLQKTSDHGFTQLSDHLAVMAMVDLDAGAKE